MQSDAIPQILRLNFPTHPPRPRPVSTNPQDISGSGHQEIHFPPSLTVALYHCLSADSALPNSYIIITVIWPCFHIEINNLKLLLPLSPSLQVLLTLVYFL